MRGALMPPKNNFEICPYQDKECPKINDIENDLNFLKKMVFQNQKILYVVIGMIAVNWGVLLW